MRIILTQTTRVRCSLSPMEGVLGVTNSEGIQQQLLQCARKTPTSQVSTPKPSIGKCIMLKLTF